MSLTQGSSHYLSLSFERPFSGSVGLLKHTQCTVGQPFLIYRVRVPTSILFYSRLRGHWRKIQQKAQGQAATMRHALIRSRPHHNAFIKY